MSKRKSLRTSESEWRATRHRPYAHPKPRKRTLGDVLNAIKNDPFVWVVVIMALFSIPYFL